MGSSCSSGQSKKDKEGKCKRSKKGKKGSDRSPRGSTASNSSLYVYQKAPTPPPQEASPSGAGGQGDTQGDTQPLLAAEESHQPAERTDSQPLSPTSPSQVIQSPKDDGLPAFAEFPEVSRPLLIGDVRQPVPLLKPRKIVLFLCSDYEDTVTERKAMLERVYKKLREHCMEKSYELEVLDLHWGLGAKGLDDHSLRDLCLRELRIQNHHAHLLPVVFLNDTLGPLLLPNELLPDVWDHLHSLFTTDEEKEMLQRWYQMENNAQPSHYSLVSVSAWRANATTANGRMCPWQEEEKLLLELLQQYCTPEQADQYLSTYLEDVLKEVLDLEEQVVKRCIWVSRKFIQRSTAKSSTEEWLQPRLESLQSRLQSQVDDSRTVRFTIHWAEGQVDPSQRPEHAQYVDELCSQLLPLFIGAVDAIIGKAEAQSPDQGFLGMERRLFRELVQQSAECRHRGDQFVSGEQVLEKIESYVHGSTKAPLIVHGISGGGKTALMAKVVQKCSEWLPTAPVVFRFVGLTPDSATAEQILRSICEQCCLLYGIHPSLASQNVSRLSKQLPVLLEKVSPSRPLVVLIDGLDQVGSFGSISVGWIPTTLPDNVKLILSLRDGTPQIQEIKALISEEECYLELPPFTAETCMQIIKNRLVQQKRVLTENQNTAIEKSVSELSLPLYAVLVASQACKWSSSLEDPPLTSDLDGQITQFLEDLEAVHGCSTMQRVLGYLTVAKQGILDSEISDFLSCDDVCVEGEITSEDYYLCVAPVIWIRIRESFEPFFHRVLVDRASVTRWCDSSFRAAVEQRYLSGESMVKVSSRLADYYQGRWANEEEQTSGKKGHCLLLAQPIQHGNAYNRRKLDELPLHLYRSGRNMDEVMPWNPSWLLAKLCGSDVYQALEDIAMMDENQELTVLKELLEVCSHALAYDGLQLFGQIVGRWSSGDVEGYPHLTALYETACCPPIASLLPIEVCLHVSEKDDEEIYFDSMHFLKKSSSHLLSLATNRGEMVVWDILEQVAVRTLKGVEQPRDVKMVDDVRGLVLCNRELKLYNLDEAAFEVKLKGVMNQKMPFYGLHDSDHVVWLSRNRMYVNMTTLQTGDQVSNFKVGEDRFLNSLLVSANGKMCVCGDETQKPFPLLVWDLDSRKLIYDLRIPHHEFITRLSAITNDGHYVVSACKEVDFPSPNFIIVYDLQSGTLFKKWKPEVNTCSISISSEGGCVVCGLEDTKLLVWDLVTGACRFSLKGHCAPPDNIKINDSGDACVTFDSTGRDRSVRLWNIAKGCAISVFTPDSYLKCCELSPDGSAVVLGLQGRPNPLTLVLCNQQSIADRVPSVPSFGNPDNANKIADVSSSG